MARALVLDSWAILAWLKNQEPAAALVRKLLEEADRKERRLTMSIVNLGEVFYLSAKAKDLAYGQRVLTALRARIHTVSAADGIVMMAANLKARHAISYADAFAAATAIRWKAPLVTGDPEFLPLADGESLLTLQWIGASDAV